MTSEPESHKIKKDQKYLLNPLEIAFCGFSGSGKTTLINKLIFATKSQYKIGYVKHDAHRFELDHPGKDTFLASENGASSVFINDKDHYSSTHQGEVDFILQRVSLLDSDLVFIEGYKNSKIPKLLFIDPDLKILDEIKSNKFDNVQAYIGWSDRKPEQINDEIPYFNRDNIEGIKKIVFDFINSKINKIALSGLVLIGGKSSRMKQDKAKLDYHGKTQTEYTFELLSSVCEKVFISCRKEQKDDFQNFSHIYDTFLDMGPLGGIISAQRAYPDTAFLVLACDLPYMDKDTLKNLINKRNPFKLASSYISPVDSMPEPLCSIYEPKSKIRLLQFAGLGYYCPRKVLLNSDTNLLITPNHEALMNINFPEEYQKTKTFFNNEMR